jgi:hypothetical protein
MVSKRRTPPASLLRPGRDVPASRCRDRRLPSAQHVDTWKTLLPCAKDEVSVVAFLRSSARAYLAPFPLGARTRLPAAA